MFTTLRARLRRPRARVLAGRAAGTIVGLGLLALAAWLDMPLEWTGNPGPDGGAEDQDPDGNEDTDGGDDRP